MRFPWFALLVLALAACGPDDDNKGYFYTETDAPPAATKDLFSPHKINSEGDWAAAYPGTGFVCATKKAGSLWCAGDNLRYQYGVEAPEKSETMVRVGEQYWSELAVSSTLEPFVCGITRGGLLSCWGTPPGGPAAKTQWLSGSGWSAVAAGKTHACGITAAAWMCWGSNDYFAYERPTAVATGTWISVAAGDQHSCGVRSDGTLWCFGPGAQAGAGGRSSREPLKISAATNWVSVAAGTGHTCALRADGTLWCWGNAESGQLGVGVSNSPSTTPLQTGSANDWTDVTAGANHTCGRRSSGKLYCWGDNIAGQLGVGSDGIRDNPTAVDDGYDWLSVRAYANTTCAVRVDGTLWCWGRVPANLHD